MAYSNRKLTAVLAAVAILCLLSGGQAFAQKTGDNESTDTGSDKEVDANVKGIVGLGLIGAELGFVLPAVAGLHETWAFIVFPIVGAGAGAVGGYFLFESGSGSPELSVAMLTAGMALIIPATIITLAATSYDPEDEPTVITTEQAGTPRPRARARSVNEMARRAGNGMIRLSDEGLFLAAPAVIPVLHPTPAEARQPGAIRSAELRISMFTGRF